MSGFSITVDEVRTTGRQLVSDSAEIADQVSVLRASQVASDDFGTAAAADVGAEYLGVTHGALAESLLAFERISSRLAEALVATFEAYENADDESQQRLRNLGGGQR